MKSDSLALAAAFVLGVLLRPWLEPLAAPLLGPQVLGPYLSTALACAAGVGLMHYLTADKLTRLVAMWHARQLPLKALGALLLACAGAVYGSAVLMHGPAELDKSWRFAAGWALLLCLVAGTALVVVTLRVLTRPAAPVA